MPFTNKTGGATSAKYGHRTLWVGLGLQEFNIKSSTYKVSLQNTEEASASNASCS